MNLLSLFFSSTFFSGLIPGTKGKGGGLLGSLVALLIQFYFVYTGLGLTANLILVFSSFFIGLLTIPGGEDYIFMKWGILKRHNEEEVNYDYNQTNIDEVHGQAIGGTSAFLFDITPLGQIILLFVSFLFFRFFDVKKTWPIKIIERKVRGAFGIMIDDTLGGIMALIATITIPIFIFLFLF